MSPTVILTVSYYPGDDTMTASIERNTEDTIKKVFTATVNEAAASGGMCQLGSILTQMMERQVRVSQTTPPNFQGMDQMIKEAGEPATTPYRAT